jgi:hypothetical protein
MYHLFSTNDNNCSSSREHEWFKSDLPEYLFPAQSDVDASIVDTDAIREVCEVGYPLFYGVSYRH